MLALDRISLVYARGSGPAVTALSQVSLDLEPGGRLGLAGPSGAGKSTLLLVAAGLLPSSSGCVARRKGLRCGLVLQEPERSLFAKTVREELSFAPSASGWPKSRIETAMWESLAAVGLPKAVLDLDPLRLPADERRLAAIAAVIAGRPEVLLLDEPTAGLDAAARLRLLDLVRGFPGSVVVAAHDLDFLWRTCPRLALLAGGRLVSCHDWSHYLAHRELLDAAGLELPEPLRVYAGLIARGWTPGDPGRDEASLAAAILGGAPGRRGNGS